MYAAEPEIDAAVPADPIRFAGEQPVAEWREAVLARRGLDQGGCGAFGLPVEAQPCRAVTEEDGFFSLLRGEEDGGAVPLSGRDRFQKLLFGPRETVLRRRIFLESAPRRAGKKRQHRHI